MQHSKIITVGDDGVGKTASLITYTSRGFPGEYIPSVFDEYSANVQVQGTWLNIALWDSAGGDYYAGLRPLSYPQTNVVLLLFSCSNPTSFQRIPDHWVPELRQHIPTVPFILVGTKTDLRTDEKTIELLESTNGRGPITALEGEAMAERVGASAYMEISSLEMQGLDELFDLAFVTSLGITKKKKNANRLSECAVM